MIQLRNGLGISPNILLVFLSVLNLSTWLTWLALAVNEPTVRCDDPRVQYARGVCETLCVQKKLICTLFWLWCNIREHRTHHLICPFSFQADAVTGYRARKKVLYCLNILIFELDRLKYKKLFFFHAAEKTIQEPTQGSTSLYLL